jgi:hypothetical protein
MNLQKEISKKTVEFFFGILMVIDERAVSISQRYGYEDPHPRPDPYQNVTDPEHG